ncbi:MAG: radical SAM protein [Nanobdellota archaeon]
MVIGRFFKIGLEGSFSGSIYRIKKLLNFSHYPTFLIYHITDQCNSRCIMCNIWKKKTKNELTLENIKKLFSSKIFSKLRWINLTGGEPFLRRDIIDVVKEINKLPKLEGIALPSNGLMPSVIVKRAEQMLQTISKDKFMSITLSIDGFEETHDKQRGIKGAYRKVMKTFNGLKELEKKYDNFNVGVQPTISKVNLHEIEDFYRFMKKKTKNIGFAVMLTSAGYYDNKDSPAALNQHDKKKIGRFFQKVLKDQPQYGFYYSKLIEMFRTGKRNFGCLNGYITLYMDPQGNATPCPILSANKKYFVGNLVKNSNAWFGKKAKRIRRDLKKEEVCETCTMMCDLINMAKVEFIEHTMFMVKHPSILKRLINKIRREKNPYF